MIIFVNNKPSLCNLNSGTAIHLLQHIYFIVAQNGKQITAVVCARLQALLEYFLPASVP